MYTICKHALVLLICFSKTAITKINAKFKHFKCVHLPLKYPHQISGREQIFMTMFIYFFANGKELFLGQTVQYLP